jgi:hypothetical protein
MKYAIKKLPSYLEQEEYYTGNSYVVQSDKYLVFDKDISKAKLYSSKKIAENAIKSINKWTCMYNLVVEEVKE